MKSFELFYEISDDLKKVEEELKKIVITRDPLLTDTSAHLLNAGGKRLRPAFALLAGKFYNYDLDKLMSLAMALELIHMASLVHDDVVDASMTRRGTPTVKAKWGNRISMHTGDFLFAKSLILIAEYKNKVIPKLLADVSIKMCEGEIQQLITSFNTHQHLKDYFYRIKRKTALLISASCKLGAEACGAPKIISDALYRYGHYLGMAFQITDDILDMVADQSELGKAVGGDLRQGIITLPIIFAMDRSNQKSRLVELIGKKEKSEDEVLEAIEIIKECGAIDEAFDMSNRFIAKAIKQLEFLPDIETRETLRSIALFVNIRRY
jgi:heptaprenyl diphosphate synthase